MINTDFLNLQYISIVEKTVDLLFEAMQDKNSEVRYQASKSLAVIALKLPSNLSDELLTTTIDYFENSDEYFKHSICLTIGEFCRRRILTPKFLPQVFKILNCSLLYEDI